MITFHCDVSSSATPFGHFWENMVGSGHASLALRADWQAQILQCHRELGFQRVRFHGLLSDGKEEALICEENQFLYSFFNVDRIFDFLLANGIRPFVELSFMPQAIASGSKTVFHYHANVSPPKDYREWDALIQKFANHLVERYGRDEVEQWFFEVWNEPNMKYFWNERLEDYLLLYSVTANALKGIVPGAKVGGPATAQNAWIDEFLERCEARHIAVDFISTHYYATDAFGKIGADTDTQLANAPDGVMRQRAREAQQKANGKPLYYTEWGISSNPRDPLHDEPFAAAFATNIIMSVQGLVQGYSYWTFSDIFEENYFPSDPFQGGFGLLNLYGIGKPAYRAFQLLHRLGNEAYPVEGKHETVSAWAVGNGNTLSILSTNYNRLRHPIHRQQAQFEIHSVARPHSIQIERIDEVHSNPRQLWQEMGSPAYLSQTQVERLQDSSQLKKEPLDWTMDDETVHFQYDLPPYSVAMATIEFE